MAREKSKASGKSLTKNPRQGSNKNGGINNRAASEFQNTMPATDYFAAHNAPGGPTTLRYEQGHDAKLLFFPVNDRRVYIAGTIAKEVAQKFLAAKQKGTLKNFDWSPYGISVIQKREEDANGNLVPSYKTSKVTGKQQLARFTCLHRMANLQNTKEVRLSDLDEFFGD